MPSQGSLVASFAQMPSATAHGRCQGVEGVSAQTGHRMVTPRAASPPPLAGTAPAARHSMPVALAGSSTTPPQVLAAAGSDSQTIAHAKRKLETAAEKLREARHELVEPLPRDSVQAGVLNGRCPQDGLPLTAVAAAAPRNVTPRRTLFVQSPTPEVPPPPPRISQPSMARTLTSTPSYLPVVAAGGLTPPPATRVVPPPAAWAVENEFVSGSPGSGHQEVRCTTPVSYPSNRTPTVLQRTISPRRRKSSSPPQSIFEVPSSLTAPSAAPLQVMPMQSAATASIGTPTVVTRSTVSQHSHSTELEGLKSKLEAAETAVQDAMQALAGPAALLPSASASASAAVKLAAARLASTSAPMQAPPMASPPQSSAVLLRPVRDMSSAGPLPLAWQQQACQASTAPASAQPARAVSITATTTPRGIVATAWNVGGNVTPSPGLTRRNCSSLVAPSHCPPLQCSPMAPVRTTRPSAPAVTQTPSQHHHRFPAATDCSPAPVQTATENSIVTEPAAEITLMGDQGVEILVASPKLDITEPSNLETTFAGVAMAEVEETSAKPATPPSCTSGGSVSLASRDAPLVPPTLPRWAAQPWSVSTEPASEPAAASASSLVDSQVTEDVPLMIDENFAAKLENVLEIADLPHEPTKKASSGDWMLWMVHRAKLNDPTLVEFDFTNVHMPAPHLEPRIAPKLMQALATNSHIEKLLLANSNLHKQQGRQLAAALRSNCTLLTANLESNSLDSGAVIDLALAIKDCGSKSALEHLRLSCQRHMGPSFGRRAEEAVAQMMQQNERIIKLGFECEDSHWRYIIDRALLRNNDIRRRLQQVSGESVDQAQEQPAVEMTLTLDHLFLHEPLSCEAPRPLCTEEKENAAYAVLRDYLMQNKKLPTPEQLQIYAKSNTDVSLQYLTAVPLIRKYRSWILDAAVGTEVSIVDAFGKLVRGSLRSWSEVNENWMVDVCGEEGRIIFKSKSREPAVSVSELWAQWLPRAAPRRGGC
mmetsp:Transcript_91575/g.158504  ORF Transcript_91575/g.158504 Transcript_91575/m.158504 type:complete len:991 (-) Transcript_91575:157-3129(-)